MSPFTVIFSFLDSLPTVSLLYWSFPFSLSVTFLVFFFLLSTLVFFFYHSYDLSLPFYSIFRIFFPISMIFFFYKIFFFFFFNGPPHSPTPKSSHLSPLVMVSLLSLKPLIRTNQYTKIKQYWRGLRLKTKLSIYKKGVWRTVGIPVEEFPIKGSRL